ncbi:MULTISPECIES: MSMEG_0570 family nitrogen starvation response protein [Halomonadaceae]|uniref:MSMEG_0570 family nitrogen starvation response protein n=1 Tax=Vreelandella halophila TaxID=86177 RepID=A0A9X4YDW4_9GAMM|nr:MULTISPECIES: MSMEG_0570 family nitrogen starvation response protein [Halomonas]MYL27906.1 MSMEG_0570 family nitrogen starvation response protein [Halomonas utahensis]MYL75032.1 MSMEG_0570 family nitrogen starvation response protein [Halomonas sp. 22501_18_FS]
MPQVWFHVRWPDERVTRCYSPSTAIRDYLAPQTDYPVADFLERSRQALTQAGERVRQKYGYACSSAADQLDMLEHTAQPFLEQTDAMIRVEEFES